MCAMEARLWFSGSTIEWNALEGVWLLDVTGSMEVNGRKNLETGSTEVRENGETSFVVVAVVCKRRNKQLLVVIYFLTKKSYIRLP